MGPGIIAPIVVLLIVVPVGMTWAKRRLKDGAAAAALEPANDPKLRLTSNALRPLPTPPWRVVYEIAPDKLGGIEHVLIGPAGIYGMRTSMDPLPAPVADPGAHDIGRAAIVRAALDDALRRCAMSSAALVEVHWGVNPDGAPASHELLPGRIAVDGRRLEPWADSLAPGALTAGAGRPRLADGRHLDRPPRPTELSGFSGTGRGSSRG